ncbi:MAG: hypothetical protein AAF414_11710 [Pseudomonadota bacterium]
MARVPSASSALTVLSGLMSIAQRWRYVGQVAGRGDYLIDGGSGVFRGGHGRVHRETDGVFGTFEVDIVCD